MEIIFLTSFFSIVIVCITVGAMIIVLNIAVQREEISKRKYKFIMTCAIVIGTFIATVLPFGYAKTI